MSPTARTGAIALGLATSVLALLLWQARDSSEASLPVLERAPVETPDEPILPAALHANRVALNETPPSVAAPEPEVDEAAAEPERELPPLPIGAIEILVLQGDEPVDGGWVHLHGGGGSWLPRERAAYMTSLPIGSDGIALATGLARGSYNVGAEVRSGIVHQRRITIPEKDGMRVVIQLGSGRVRGHVYDDEGAPVEGARVQVGSVDGSTASYSLVSRQHTAVVWTGADGAYDVSSVPAGFTWVSANMSGSQHGLGDKDMLSIQLEEGETRVVDFGRPTRTPMWSGTVHNEAGDPVLNYGPPGTTGTMHFVNAATDGYREVAFGADGSFQVLLLPGTYEVRVNPPSRRDRQLLFDAFVMEDADLERDVTIKGTRVTGTILQAATGETLVPTAGKTLQIGLRESVDHGPEFRCRLGPDGTYTIDGVEPGTWLVSTWPNTLVADTLVTTRPGDVTVRLDLTVE